MLISTDKNNVMESVFENTQFLLKYIPAKRMDGLQIIGVDKDLIKTVTMLFKCVKQLVSGTSIKITIQFEMETVPGFKRKNLEI